MLSVLLDLRMVHGALHGIARYALELARRIPPLAPDLQFSALVSPEGLPADLGDLAPRIPVVRCSATFLSPFEQPALTATLFRERPELFHATSFSLPALWPGRLVATIHDATHLALPEGRDLGRAAYYRFVVGPRSRSAKALITVSEFSRAEVAKHLALSPYRLQVISNGVDSIFHRPAASELDDFRARRGLPLRYFAAIGSPKPHKNLRVLTTVSEQLGQPLVLLAGRGARRALGFTDNVLELAPLPDADLIRFYAAATAVLVPSRYEGFGLPALEAMACGAPVIAAAAGALPEIVGPAGLLVSPDDPSAWKDACLRLHRDAALCENLSTLGHERSARFDWDTCARQTLEAYRRALTAPK